eukprot:scaffold2779_cov376-Prasinococcus_capsulatus_cf.AAC.3
MRRSPVRLSSPGRKRASPNRRASGWSGWVRVWRRRAAGRTPNAAGPRVATLDLPPPPGLGLKVPGVRPVPAHTVCSSATRLSATRRISWRSLAAHHDTASRCCTVAMMAP